LKSSELKIVQTQKSSNLLKKIKIKKLRFKELLKYLADKTSKLEEKLEKNQKNKLESNIPLKNYPKTRKTEKPVVGHVTENRLMG
jgi:hypothetical protein